MDFYKVGDYVLVQNSITDKMDIGRITEMTEHSSSVTYIRFYKPEDTHCGRLSYHGKNEIFRTVLDNEESISHIISKVEIIKPQDYSKIPREEKFASDLFVCRQKYDVDEEKFSPELEPDCFCNRILNPDDDLVVCECERLFHYHCISSEQNSCPTCDYFLMNVGDTLYKKRKIEEDTSVLLKSSKEDEFYEMFANALDDVEKEKNTSHHQNYSYGRGLNEKRPLSALDLNRGNIRGSMKGAAQNFKAGPPKKQTRKELVNIDDDAYDRIKHALSQFSKAHQNKSMADVDKSRYFLKEKYYKSLLYGIEEVKERQRVAGSHLHLSDSARKIALTDLRENYRNAQNLALNIEAVVWHTMNKNKARIDPNYSMKNRELLNYMMDDNNFELRLAVLVGEKKPEFLCQASGKELVSKEVSEKIEKKELKTLKLSLLPDEIKIIAKSHKGESVIEAAENPAEPKLTTETVREEEVADDDSDTLTDLVHKIERRQSEPFDNADKPYYNDNSMVDEPADFGAYKLNNKQKKMRKDQDEDSLSDSSENLLSNTLNNLRKNAKKSLAKNYEDPMISNAGNNKLIDQDVLKSVMSFFFENTYNKVTERIRNHLRPEIASDILDGIERKHPKE